MLNICQLVLIALWMCLLAGATILCMLPLEFFCLDVLGLLFFSWRTEYFEGCAVWVVSVRHMGFGHILLASLGWLRSVFCSVLYSKVSRDKGKHRAQRPAITHCLKGFFRVFTHICIVLNSWLSFFSGIKSYRSLF